MKKLIWSALAVLAAVSSCQVDELHNGEMVSGDEEFYAIVSNDGTTKTVMDENNNIRWSEDDQLVIFRKTSLGLKYQIQDSYVGKTYGYFSKVVSGSESDDVGAGMELDHNVAYYPYSGGVSAVKQDAGYKLDVVLPSEQTYSSESFGNGAFPMAAVSEDNDLTFRNVCGGIKLQFKGTGRIASVKIEGRNGEKLSGAATVTVYTDETVPTIAMSDNASTSVTLNCGDGVWLNAENATEFIIALPPTTFAEGFNITVTDIYGERKFIETSRTNEVLRSSLLTMPELEVNMMSSVSLSENGTANCYIVSEAGPYKFTPTKGNSSESVGTIASAEVLWETFGTDVTPAVGDLVKNVRYEDGVIRFEIPTAYQEGNAVIAAKDADGTILWSWHIWLTDEPEEQQYYNNAGIMMDRNLGATSATPGNAGARGLLYQWGRKDPFLNSSSINESTEAKSTIAWPSAVSSDSNYGTIEYATANPTTFIAYNTKNYDWYYTGSSSTDYNRWTRSSYAKSIYDPCPYGWRVPDGGSNGVWSKAVGSSSYFEGYPYDSTNMGMNFSGKFGADSIIWYPSSGMRNSGDGCLNIGGNYWSASVYYENPNNSYYMFFVWDGRVYPSSGNIRAAGCSVRCVQE